MESVKNRTDGSRLLSRDRGVGFATPVRSAIPNVPSWLLTLVLAGLVLIPLAKLLLAAGGDGIASLIAYPGIDRIIWTTVLLALGSLVIAVVLGTGLAWCSANTPQRVRAWIGTIPLLSLVVPAVANTTGWVFLLSPSAGYLNAAIRNIFGMPPNALGPIDIFSVEWIIILTGFSFTGYVYLYVHSSMETMGTELSAAARISGASPIKVFWTVTLPLLKPAIAYSSGVVLLLGLGQFTNPLLLGTAKHIDVLTTVLFRTQAAYPIDYSLGAALSAPLILAGVIIMIVQRRIIGNQARYTVVTGKSSYKGVKGSWWATLPIFLFAFFSMILPVGAIILVSVSRFWSASIDLTSLTLTHIQQTFAKPAVLSALNTTLIATLIAILIAVPLGLLAARAMTGRLKAGPNVNRAIDLLVTLPLGMPAAIFGFAALYTYAVAPFNLYGTLAIIAIAYVTLMIPHAMRPQLTTLLSIGKEYSEASKVSGAGPARTFFSVEFPMMRSGVATASVMVFILLSHEFAASLMIASANNQTLGTLLFQLFEGGIYPQVASLALLMVALTTLGLVALFAMGGRKALS